MRKLCCVILALAILPAVRAEEKAKEAPKVILKSPDGKQSYDLTKLASEGPVEAVFQAAALCDFGVARLEDRAGAPVGSAKIASRAGEITIVAVGPLTNVATVLKEDPSIATLIKAIVMMGGSLSGGNITPAAEFNFYVDPEAARIVFDSGVPLTMVGLDVTRKVQLHEDNIKELEAAKNPVSQAAAKIMRASFDRIKKDRPNPSFAMHDPLTVAHLIDPTILTLKDYYVQIETQGEITAGESIGWEHAPVHRSPPLDTGMPAGEPADAEFKPNAKVAVEVDSDKFFKLLIPRLTAPM